MIMQTIIHSIYTLNKACITTMRKGKVVLPVAIMCMFCQTVFSATAIRLFTTGSISPQTQSVFSGTSAATISLVGPDVTGYRYQWQISTNGSTFYNISGATSISYSPGAISQTQYYQVYMTSTTTGQSVYSPIATVNINAHLAAGTVTPASLTINYNISPGQLTSTTPTGGIGSYVYQWQQSADNSTFTDISGATALTYTPGSLTANTYYKLKITCGTEVVYTNSVLITVYPQLVAGSISPTAITINYSSTPGQLTGTAATGGNSTYAYQWQSSSDNSTWTNVSGATSQNYTPGSLTATTYYRRAVTSNGVTSYTASSKVTVYPQLVMSVSPSTITINYNANLGQFVTTTSGGDGTYTYNWKSSTDGSTWTTISGATSSTYSPGNLTISTSYRVTAISNNASTSIFAVVTVYPQVIATISPVSSSINYNSSPGQLTSTVSGGNSSYTYQWQSSVDNSTWVNISGATSQNYTPGSLTATTYYRVVTTSNGASVNSNTTTITVYPQLTSSITPTSTTINYNTSPGLLTNTRSGGNSTYTYQWQSSADNSTWTAISGATSQNYTPGSLTAPAYYRVITTSNGVFVTSNTVTVTVYPQLTTSVSPTSTSINYNTSPGLLTNTRSGGSGTYTYQWQSSIDNSTWTAVSGATAQNYTPGSLTATTYYRVVTTSNGVSVTSNTTTITVYPQLATSVSPTSASINYNTGPGLLANTRSGGNGTYTYQWQSSVDNSTWVNISGATAQNYTPGSLTAITYYRVVTTSNGVSVTSNISTISIYPQLVAGSISPVSLNINYNTSPGQLTGTTATGGNGTYIYQWQSSADSSTWTNISSATAQQYTPGNLTSKIYYKRVATSNGVSLNSNVITIFVYTQLVAGTVSPTVQTRNNYGAISDSLTASPATGGNGIYTYQWQSSTDNNSWTNISAATLLSYLPATVTYNSYYRLSVTSNGVIAYSNTSIIYAPLNGGEISASAAIVSSGSAATLNSVSAATNGNCTVYSYQWQSSPDEYDWTNIPSTSITNLTTTTYFRRQASCNGNIAYSNIIRVKVQATVTSQLPDLTTAPAAGTQQVITMPAYSSSLDTTNMNYIRLRIYAKPGITDTALARTEANVYGVQQVTDYFDGLGRPLQTVAKHASPDMSDMIGTNFYDSYSRQTQVYQQYSDAKATGNFRIDPATKQPAFYNAFFSNQESYYYSNNTFENSMLNRVQKTTAPGKSWTGHNVGIKQKDRGNTLQDSVVIWNIDTSMSSLPQKAGYYSPGTLYVHETTDEHDNKIIEYKNFDEILVLKKVQLTDAGYPAYDNWTSTYYVYDDLNNQRYILSPKAVQYLSHNSWIMTQGISDELCFKYSYDKRKRLIQKTVPGTGVVNMVYDGRERLVMTQDSSLRKNGQWLVMTYDSLDRAVKVILWNNTGTIAYHQGIAYNSNAYPVLSGTYSVQTEVFYDDYSWQSNYTDIGTTHTFSSTFNNATDLPIIQDNNYALTASAVSPQTRGLVTGMRTKVLDPDNANLYQYAVNWYDDHNRILQMQSKNITGEWDTLTIRYDFGGKILSTCETHSIAAIAGTVKYSKLVTAHNYDANGIELLVKKYLNGSSSGTTIVSKTYDQLGQLKSKVLGNSLETQNYTYNIRGWMKSINKDFVTTSASSSNWFGQEMSYDYGFSKSLYNGNMAGIKWKSLSDGIARSYGYSYDPVNRITSAVFNQQNSGSTAWTQDKVDFSVDGLTYDVNGNISTMTQKGMIGITPTVIDKLTYSYLTNSNKLSAVADTANNAAAKLGDFINGVNSGNDYSYNGNGSLISDQNKKSTVSYNYLNLPDTIKINGKGNIHYIYDAAGIKLKKITTDSTVTPVKITTTTYTGAYVYQNDTLQYISFEEGRLRAKRIDTSAAWTSANTRYYYDYFVKDHLGDIRMILTTQTDTAVYAATMENAATAKENALFSNIDNTRTALPAGYPVDNTTNPNEYVAGLNASNGQKIGPSLVLRVMAGDTIQLGVKAFYKSTGASTSTTTSSNMLIALLQTFSGTGVSEGVHAATGTASPIATNFSSSDYDALKQKDPTQNLSDKPKAYLNYALFDNSFSMVNENSGVKQVQGNPDELQTLATDKMVVKRTGFLYIYTSNESSENVYFDNLVVVHNNGPLLDETHYYPFGLTMAGISSSALKGSDYATNRLKYNGKELQSGEFKDGSGLELYDYGARFYDAQIGAWHTIDPHSERYNAYSPYVYVGNNPLLFTDPDGRDWFYYSKDGKSPPTWNWHDGSEYNTGVKDENGEDIVLHGTEAVVVFEGSKSEHLGTLNKSPGFINGEEGLIANVTVYGPDGEDDIHHYNGYTMSSNPKKYGVVRDGIYDGNFDVAGKSGALKSHWTINKRGHVPDDDGCDPLTGEGYLEGVFIHSSNQSGFAGEYWSKKSKKMEGISEGCLLIHPNDWSSFNKTMQGVQNFKVQVYRDTFAIPQYLQPPNSGGYYYLGDILMININ